MAIITMFCFGSWPATQRKCGDWRFEAWYLDFAWSIVAGTFLVGLLLGGVSPSGWSANNYLHMLSSAHTSAIVWALFAGIVWGAGNFLLAVAIRLTGLALAFPIGIGLALALGTSLAYVTNPSATAHPMFLFIGLVLVLLAIGANALAHTTKHAHIPTDNLKLGVAVAVICGVLIALFPSPFNFAFDNGLTGEAGALYMAIGALIINAFLVPYYMRHPIVPNQKPIGLFEYGRAKLTWHLWAALGGLIWATGMVFQLVVANQPKFSVAIAYTLGQGAVMVAAIWGIFVWKEFAGAPKRAHQYLALMFLLFIVGIIFIAKATG
ncbi:MAG: GRP family sugar transporter [Patescibacteria group bacterium]